MIYLVRREKPEGKLAKLARENRLLSTKILEIYNESDDIYGALKIHKTLYRDKEIDFTASKKRVSRIMKQLGIHSDHGSQYRLQ